jgi:myo-inositol 2-dehydrogenase / D-chiro-inositol 1-dehydrogenase
MPMNAANDSTSTSISDGDSNREVRYGVIGTGMMGREHLRNIAALPGAHTVAYSDPHGPSLELAAAALEGQPKVVSYTSHLELLARDDLDAILIASPNFTHVNVAADVLRLRPDLHLMIEKPLCTTTADCQTLIDLRDARPAGSGIVWVGLEYRYMPPVARLISELRSGVVGELKMVAIREHRFPFLVKVDNWNRFTANTVIFLTS